ncbi:MAG: cobalt-precorrin 5A hydrolase [Peptostreptococcaceae bacterium]|nr:cobalt-precorrin 5A hydrolase [Peptostreptococcaceae bacterium]
MSTGILVLTKNALQNAKFLRSLLLKDGEEAVVYAPKKLEDRQNDAKVYFYEEKFSKIVSHAYQSHHQLIFIMAAGIVVRSMAQLLKDKTLDPAVVVMDERLRYAVSLVGGHVAGANELAVRLEKLLNCQAVITTATDVNEAGALDLIARDLKAYRNEQRDLYKAVNLALAQREKVFLIRDEQVRKERLDLRGFTLLDKMNLLEQRKLLRSFPKAPLLYIGIRFPEKDDEKIERIIPKRLILGMGCRKNTPYAVIAEVFEEFMKMYGFSEEAVSDIVSIDLKKDEEGLIALAERLNADFYTYTAEEIGDCIRRVGAFSGSEFVRSITGVPAVAEPCAYIASGGSLITERFAENGVTIAAGYRYFQKDDRQVSNRDNISERRPE